MQNFRKTNKKIKMKTDVPEALTKKNKQQATMLPEFQNNSGFQQGQPTILNEQQEGAKVTIPENFCNAVNEHLVGNILDLPDYPLIMAIFGEPGMGKTFQLRTLLEYDGFQIHSINAADLESDRAGEPAKLLRKEYVDASAKLVSGMGAAIVIDDVDTTLGEWEKYTGTVNHQDLIAFFMHMADNPSSMENINSDLQRVPIFFTGNDFSKLYGPLKRPGRMNLFEYKPTPEEKLQVLTSIFGKQYSSVISSHIAAHENAPIAFYASLKAQELSRTFSQIVKNIDYRLLIGNESYRESIKRDFKNTVSRINWEKLIQDNI